jgi:histidinol-phosphatase
MRMTDYTAERRLLDTLLPRTRALILGHYGRVAVERKADGTDVTVADRDTERLIRAALAETFPGDGIVGEEYGATGDPRRGRCWLLDPIDGTTWFTLGVPMFATLIALLEDGEPVLGVVDLPALDQTWTGVRGGGSWLRDRHHAPQRLAVRAPRPLREGFGSASGIHDTAWAPRGGTAVADLGALTRAMHRFRFCGDALQHMLVARGTLDVAVDLRMAAWDSAALIPVLEEAGGAVCDLDGRREGVVFSGNLLSASHPALLADARAHLGRRAG